MTWQGARVPELPALVVRTATPADVPAVLALVESAYRGESSRAGWTTEADLLGGQRTDAREVAAAMTGPDRVVLVHDRPAGLTACCALTRRPTAAYFGMFAVSPTAQGNGVGGGLLRAAEQWVARRWAATQVEMTVLAQRPELLAWYDRRGYRPTGGTEPFPYGDPRFGLPRRDDLQFLPLARPIKALRPEPPARPAGTP